MSESYYSIEIGTLISSKSFINGYAIVIDRRIDWCTTPISCDYQEWIEFKVIECDGTVKWIDPITYKVKVA